MGDMTASQISFGHLSRLEPRLAELLLEISLEPERVEDSDFCSNELWLSAYKPRLILLVGIGLGAEVLQPVLCSSDAYAIAYSTLYDAMPSCRRCGCAG